MNGNTRSSECSGYYISPAGNFAQKYLAKLIDRFNSFNINILIIMSTNNDQEVKTCLLFKLNEEEFAIDVSKVLNILEMSQITRIPKAPDYMKGVTNLRGTVLPVVDLRIKFGLLERENTVDTGIIVLSINLKGESVLIGALVDAVREVLELKSAEISQAPAIGCRSNSGFIEGMWCHGEKYIMILDIDKVFSTDEVIDFEEQIIDTVKHN